MKTKTNQDKDDDGVNDPDERLMDTGHSPHTTKIDWLIHRLTRGVDGQRG